MDKLKIQLFYNNNNNNNNKIDLINDIRIHWRLILLHKDKFYNFFFVYLFCCINLVIWYRVF